MTITRRQFALAGGCWGLSACLAPLRARAAAADWADARQAGPFIWQSTFPIGDYDALIPELYDLQNELVRVLRIPRATDPIYIYSFANQDEHRQFLRQRLPDHPYRRALFHKQGGEASVYVYNHRELAIDLRHECTHGLLHDGLMIVPLWLDEGIAKYFEVPKSDRAFGHPHLFNLRWQMRLGIVKTIEGLEAIGELAQMDAGDYRYAWAWTHFLLHGPPEGHRELVAYLDDIRRGVPPGRLSARVERAVPNSVERMVRHFKHWQPPNTG